MTLSLLLSGAEQAADLILDAEGLPVEHHRNTAGRLDLCKRRMGFHADMRHRLRCERLRKHMGCFRQSRFDVAAAELEMMGDVVRLGEGRTTARARATCYTKSCRDAAEGR